MIDKSGVNDNSGANKATDNQATDNQDNSIAVGEGFDVHFGLKSVVDARADNCKFLFISIE